MRVKNLSPDILDNNNVINLERIITAKADENIGNQMIFEMCDVIREQIADMNEKILNEL